MRFFEKPTFKLTCRKFNASSDSSKRGNDALPTFAFGTKIIHYFNH